MKSVLITGGSGFFGTAFTKHLLLNRPDVERVVIYSRGEHRQAAMYRELGENKRLRMFIGDTRDRDRLRRALAGVDTVVHAAALKRIEVGFYNPVEMVRTNVDGAINLVEAAQDAGVQKVIALSSDKAYEPISPYGHTKALAESLFLASNNTTGGKGPIFSVARYGNIWGSTGSVVPTWKAILAGGGESVPITDPDCTRFYMTIQQAIDLVIDTIKTMKGGEVAIPVLPAYRLGDLADAMGAKTIIIGLPKWEKAHESMGKWDSSDKARRMSIKELQEALCASS